jgi:hypothetical protein
MPSGKRNRGPGYSSTRSFFTLSIIHMQASDIDSPSCPCFRVSGNVNVDARVFTLGGWKTDFFGRVASLRCTFPRLRRPKLHVEMEAYLHGCGGFQVPICEIRATCSNPAFRQCCLCRSRLAMHPDRVPRYEGNQCFQSPRHLSQCPPCQTYKVTVDRDPQSRAKCCIAALSIVNHSNHTFIRLHQMLSLP